MPDRSEWKQPGGPYPALYNVEAGVNLARDFDDWWEAEPVDEEGPWLVTLQEPDSDPPVVVRQREFLDYHEALNWGESMMPEYDVDIDRVAEA